MPYNVKMDKSSRLILGLFLGFIFIAILFQMQPTQNTTLEAISIGVIDDYSFDLETKKCYSFLTELAEQDIRQYLQEEDIDVELDVVFYPVDNWEDTLDAVRDCYNNNTFLMVGFPDNLSLDLAMSYRYRDLMLVSVGSSQPFGMNLDDSVYRLFPNRYHKLKPLAQMIFEQGKRIVIPVADFSDGIEEFSYEYELLSGKVETTFWYDWSLQNGTRVLDFDIQQLSGVIQQVSGVESMDDIAIVYFGHDEIAEILEYSLNYPIINSVSWFSYNEITYWEDSFKDLNYNFSQVGLFSLVANVSDTESFRKIDSEFKTRVWAWNEFG